MATKKSDRVKQAVKKDMAVRDWDSLERHTVPVAVRLDENVVNRFKRYCDARGLKVSQKLREIIMEWILNQRIV